MVSNGARVASDRATIVRNVCILWLACAILFGISRFLPAVGSSALRSAATGIFLLVGIWVLMDIVARQIDRRAFPRDWGLSFGRGSAPLFLLGLAIGFAMIGIQVANISLFGDVTIVRNDDLPISLVVSTTVSFIAWAAVEELGFRSYALFRLNDAFGFWRAQLVVALVFAVYHIVGGVPLIPALLGTTVGSLAFGAAALASRGLALPIGLHAAWNIGEWLMGSKGDRFASPWRLDIADSSAHAVQIAGLIGYYVLYGAVFAACLVYLRRHRPNLANGPG